jgi:hypothetical protein
MDDTTNTTATEVDPAAPQEAISAASSSMPAVAPNWLDQDPVLRDLWSSRLSPEQIAEKLGRSVAAVMTRAARLGLPRRFAPGRKAGKHYARVSPVVRPVVRAPAPSNSGEASTQATERVCLMCLRKFQSEGRHNRICPNCKGSPEYEAGNRIPDINFGDI